MAMFLSGIIFALICMVTSEIAPTENYPYMNAIDSNGNVNLYWKYDQTSITFEVHANTTGWIGIGISPNGTMAFADMYVGWVKEGIVNITDRHGVDHNTFPPLDNQQNAEVLAGSECDGWTLVKFQRPLAACESGDDIQITGGNLNIIWAYGKADPTGNDIQPSDYHSTNRGGKTLALLQPATLETDIGTLDEGNSILLNRVLEGVVVVAESEPDPAPRATNCTTDIPIWMPSKKCAVAETTAATPNTTPTTTMPTTITQSKPVVITDGRLETTTSGSGVLRPSFILMLLVCSLASFL